MPPLPQSPSLSNNALLRSPFLAPSSSFGPVFSPALPPSPFPASPPSLPSHPSLAPLPATCSLSVPPTSPASPSLAPSIPFPFSTVRPNRTDGGASVWSCLAERKAFVWPCLIERNSSVWSCLAEWCRKGGVLGAEEGQCRKVEVGRWERIGAEKWGKGEEMGGKGAVLGRGMEAVPKRRCLGEKGLEGVERKKEGNLGILFF